MFERRGHLPDREGLTTEATELHLGNRRIQCFWSLTHGDYKSQVLCCINLDLWPLFHVLKPYWTEILNHYRVPLKYSLTSFGLPCLCLLVFDSRTLLVKKVHSIQSSEFILGDFRDLKIDTNITTHLKKKKKTGCSKAAPTNDLLLILKALLNDALLEGAMWLCAGEAETQWGL